MSLPRTIARRLLVFLTRHSDPESRPWLEAMRAELAVVEGEWAALRWAWGGAGIVVRRSLQHTRPTRRVVVLATATAGLLCIAWLRRPLKETRPVSWANTVAAATGPGSRR